MGQRIAWVTGARGFLGRHLSKECEARGWLVGGIGRGAWRDGDAARWGIAAWAGESVSSRGLDHLGERVGSPTAIYHMAGGSSVSLSIAAPADDFRDTVLSTLEVLEWARTRSTQASIVIASSAAVYGEQKSGAVPIAETATVRPRSPYGAHKLAAEQLCEYYAREFGLDITVVRMFSVYGPWLRKQLLWDLCSKLSDGPKEIVLFGTGEEKRDFLHVADAVALVRSLGEARGRRGGRPILNAGTGIATTVSEVAHLVAAAFGGTTALRFSGEVRRGDPHHLVADVSRARQLGWRHKVRLNDGIEEYVSWFRAARVPAPA